MISRGILDDLGRVEIHESLLRLLGSVNMTSVQVGVHQKNYIKAFDRLNTFIQTPFWGDFYVNQMSRPNSVAGSWKMIRGGFPREAMLWILSMHSFCNEAIENDAPATEKSELVSGYRHLLDALGLKSLSDFKERARFAEKLLGQLTKAVDSIILSNQNISP